MSQPPQEFSAVPAALDRGLFVVQTSPDLRLSTAVVMVGQVAGAKADLGIKMPAVDRIVILQCGSGIQRSRLRQTIESATPHRAKLDFSDLPEGVHDSTLTLPILSTWLPRLQSEGAAVAWWVIMHTCDQEQLPVDSIKVLGRIRGKAKKAGVRVLVILAMPDGAGREGLEYVADELLCVEACESDVTGARCISFDSCGLSELGVFGAGKIMCLIGQSPQGITFAFEPFVARELDQRVMVKLRGHGMTFEQIGDIVNRDKATPHRHLKGWPVVPQKVSQAWIELVRDYYDAAPRKSGKRDSSIEDDDALDNGDDEDDDD